MSDPLRPFRPDEQRPWDRVRACHLLRRAGFAPSEAEIRRAIDDGPDGTVDRLLADTDEPERWKELDAIGPHVARREISALRGWTLLRMVETARPLHARMAMLWHDHFATSNAKVADPALMLTQFRLFETHGLGSFETLLMGVARDPAMIIWLDGNANTRGRPNENFARELFELFALGLGAYSERDVREASRAFTGWHERDGAFRFAARQHDTGSKTFLGRAGDWDGDDVIRIVVEHPACARFIARRLLQEFVCPEPLEQDVHALGSRLRSTRLDIGDAVSTILRSELMFDPRWYRARIKSPVEFMVGLARSLELRVPAADLADRTTRMGEAIFDPPSVAGWEGHRAWLNSATMLVRLNTALTAAHGGWDADFAGLRRRYQIPAAESARFFGGLVLDGRIEPGMLDTSGALDDAGRSRRALEILLTSPEYQMA